VTPDTGGWTWGLELAGSKEVTRVIRDGAKISYVRGEGLTEWFVNDARGLEQGWTLSRRLEPADHSGEFSLDLVVRGDLRPEISANGASVAFLNDAGIMTMTYGGLKAWDANGKIVPVHFETNNAGCVEFRVVVDDGGAKYPISIDPVAQQAYLKASNTEFDDSFGRSVAVDGDTVVVGAWFEDSSATGVNGNQADNSAANSGAAYVFVRSGATWSQQAYLKASNTDADDHFGCAVAVSGETVVVGANWEASNATGVNGNQSDNSDGFSGAAYVFVRNGTSWTEQAYLKASFPEASVFGGSVAMSGDTLVVGTYGIYGGFGGEEAYVFVRSGGTWTQQAALLASNMANGDVFGCSVAVSGDTVVVGAWNEKSNATGVNGDQSDNSLPYAGAAYVFVRSGTDWAQQAYLKASNTGDRDAFGSSVAVSGDTVVVGAYGEDSNATGVNGNQTNNSAAQAGAIYVFARSGTTWSQQAYLKASNTGAGDSFGYSVAVSGDTLVAGAPSEASSATGVNGNQTDNSTSSAGAVYVFVRNGTSWAQQAYVKASNTGAGDAFGSSVALSGDTLVATATAESSSATGVNGNQAINSTPYAGAAYVFLLQSALLSTVTDGHGSVAGSGNYQIGATATLNASPIPGYVFACWSGDATGTDNPLSILMDADKNVIASFGPDTSDTDGDGLSAHDELVIYGTNPGLADTDVDGYMDGSEVEFGGNPLVASSAPEFKIHALLMPAAGMIQLRFPALQGASHSLQNSIDLRDWSDLETDIIGRGQVVTRAYPTVSPPQRFFRVTRN
jgi:uncharacterized repeat protein (TIGR02543 family)